MEADLELAKSWKEVNQKKLGEFMLQNSADWIQWKKNPPLASHMSGLICRKHTLIFHEDTQSKFGGGIT